MTDLRPADIVMDLERLGTSYPYPLSFMRMLTRRLLLGKWQIDLAHSSLDAEGHGDAIYEINAPQGLFSFVVFAKYLDPDKRSDRVIAEDWDMTATLCAGEVDTQRLEFLRAQVPLQEKGRVDTDCLVLTRANKSVRNFEYVVDCLASGQQPDMKAMAKVGYLYRTTAVYGSGKFGMADWEKVRLHYPDFASPFAAEMLSCFLIRDFSLMLADHVAQARGGAQAVHMSEATKRYVGIGNATGLGMAPYLIYHPLLINRWVEIRERALSRVKLEARMHEQSCAGFIRLAQRAIQHLQDIETDNTGQNAINTRAREELGKIISEMERGTIPVGSWTAFTDSIAARYGVETQELVNTLLLEIYPDLYLDLEAEFDVTEEYKLEPDMPIPELILLIEDQYNWALDYDFSKAYEQGVFWYRSEEKMEPRLGQRKTEPGADKEMLIGMARAVQTCHAALEEAEAEDVATFVCMHPEHRYIIRRIQTMARTAYGDIRANLLAADVLPIHLLRCKLSFFGVGKFDPRSRLWVRNTMFQGAPLVSDIIAHADVKQLQDWAFPVRPDMTP